MIEKVVGTVSRVEPTAVVLEVGPVSLRMSVPLSTSSRVKPGTQATLWTELVVREDSLALFGFASEREREYFNRLRAVSGIGPKLACAILSGVSVDMLEQAITTNQPGLLARIPGIGKKTAGRIVVELSGKVETQGPPAALDSPVAEATAALTNLGYPRPVAVQAVDKALADLGPSATAEQLVRTALKWASQRKAAS